MKLLFTYSSKVGSRFIRWALDESVSHVAVSFSNGLVIHSTFGGVHLDWGHNFRLTHCIPYEFDIGGAAAEDELKVLTSLLDIYIGREYDYGAFLYLGVRMLMKKLLGIPLPIRNVWDDKKKYLCTEMADVLLGYVPDPMITPYQLYNKLLKEPSRA